MQKLVKLINEYFDIHMEDFSEGQRTEIKKHLDNINLVDLSNYRQKNTNFLDYMSGISNYSPASIDCSLSYIKDILTGSKSK